MCATQIDHHTQLDYYTELDYHTSIEEEITDDDVHNFDFCLNELRMATEELKSTKDAFDAENVPDYDNTAMKLEVDLVACERSLATVNGQIDRLEYLNSQTISQPYRDELGLAERDRTKHTREFNRLNELLSKFSKARRRNQWMAARRHHEECFDNIYTAFQKQDLIDHKDFRKKIEALCTQGQIQQLDELESCYTP